MTGRVARRPIARRNPFLDFVGPGRRRTDHPWVVGTIVLCCGLITLASIAQIGATLWAGTQVALLIERDRQDKTQVAAMRQALVQHAESQTQTLRRVCLNSARTDNDRLDCLAPPPPAGPRGR